MADNSIMRYRLPQQEKAPIYWTAAEHDEVRAFLASFYHTLDMSLPVLLGQREAEMQHGRHYLIAMAQPKDPESKPATSVVPEPMTLRGLSIGNSGHQFSMHASLRLANEYFVMEEPGWLFNQPVLVYSERGTPANISQGIRLSDNEYSTIIEYVLGCPSQTRELDQLDELEELGGVVQSDDVVVSSLEHIAAYVDLAAKLLGSR